MMSEKEEYYRMTVEEALESFDTSEDGLTSEEAENRLEKHGKNELKADIGTPKWLMLLSQLKKVLVLVLIVAGFISLAIKSYNNAAAMFIIVGINAVIGFFQEYKAEKIVEKLRDLVKSPAKAIREGKTVEINQRKLVPGDIVRVEEGDKIPADMRVIKSFNFKTDDASLTGESETQDKYAEAMNSEATLADKTNIAWTGTTVSSGWALGVVTETGMDTEIGKVTDLTQTTEELKSPLQKELTSLAYKLTGAVVIISTILFFVSIWQDFSVVESLVIGVGVAVSAVPQALPAQVTVSLSTGSNRLADKNAVVKSLPAVETLGATSIICTDKTGTLTKNEMTVQSMWFDGKKYELTGIGYEPEGKILDESGEELSDEQIGELEIMMDAATMASNAEIHEPDEEHTGWYNVGDPTEAALITASRKIGTRSEVEDEENPELKEFSFDSERKRMSSVREIEEEYDVEDVARQFEDKVVLTVKGAVSSILSISESIYREGEVVPITEEDEEKIGQVTEEYSEDAMRVLAIAFRPLKEKDDYRMESTERNLIFLGLMAMIDPPKEGVDEAIEETHQAQVRTFVMTGDHATTAKAVGREIGLTEEGEESEVVTGEELKGMSKGELDDLTRNYESVIFSRVDPEDKLRIVEALQNQDEVVAVTGDGVNDSPALKKADVGVAMGKKGTDVAKEASELVLLDDSYPTLVNAVEEGRTVYQNLSSIVKASMTTNSAELATVMAGLFAVAMWDLAMPIFIIQILAIDLLAEIMPLTFLTFDPPTEDTMKRPPRDLSDHIINRVSGVEIMLLGTLIGFLAFMNFNIGLGGLSVTTTLADTMPLTYVKATTLSYLTIASCQWVNILSRRGRDRSIFHGKEFFSNKVLLASTVASILIVLFIGLRAPVVSGLLKLAPAGTMWIWPITAAGVYLGVFELMKFIKRRKASQVQE